MVALLVVVATQRFLHGAQAYMGVITSAWSYNALISAWEPILEPWDFILKADINSSAMVHACTVQRNTDKPCWQEATFCACSSCTPVPQA